VGEPATDGETPNSQDRLMVNPAGAGRKIERLSREVCHSVPRIGTTYAAMCGDGETEVSRGHKYLKREGLNIRTQGINGGVRGRGGAENQTTGLRL
jgi:hypothetical protein